MKFPTFNKHGKGPDQNKTGPQQSTKGTTMKVTMSQAAEISVHLDKDESYDLPTHAVETIVREKWGTAVEEKKDNEKN